MPLINVTQGSPEWMAARLPRLTGSQTKRAVTKKRSGEGLSEAAETLALEIASRICTGEWPSEFTSPAMQWGVDHEPEARRCFEVWEEKTVEATGLWTCPGLDFLAASPDGLVGDDAVLEIKCPTSKTHVATIIAGTIPDEYIWQVTAELLCTGRKLCYFVSYDPRNQFCPYFVIKHELDQTMANELLTRASMVENRVQEIIAKVQAS